MTSAQTFVRDMVTNFNSHAHVERDREFFSRGIFIINFNSHAHVERDNQLATLVTLDNDFNSHAHVERDVTNYGNLWQE